MALARTYAMALAGVRGHVVEIEADIEKRPGRAPARGSAGHGAAGGQGPDPVGDRQLASVLAAAADYCRLVTGQLAQAGQCFDVAIAVAILSADGVLSKEGLAGTVFLGELGLDGRIRPVPGVLPSVAAAVAGGFSRVVVPVENAAEAAWSLGRESWPRRRRAG